MLLYLDDPLTDDYYGTILASSDNILNILVPA